MRSIQTAGMNFKANLRTPVRLATTMDAVSIHAAACIGLTAENEKANDFKKGKTRMTNQNENAAVSDVTARMRKEASIRSLLNGQRVCVERY